MKQNDLKDAQYTWVLKWMDDVVLSMVILIDF